MTPNNPSKLVSLEAVEAALRAIDRYGVVVRPDVAEAAILAADEARRMRVERFEARSRYPGQPRVTEERLVSAWFSIKG